MIIKKKQTYTCISWLMDGLINNIFGGECITIFYITKESFNIVQGEVEGNVTFFEVMNFRLV